MAQSVKQNYSKYMAALGLTGPTRALNGQSLRARYSFFFTNN